MRVVISGPTGAIGMALIKECIENQIEVLAICHKGSKRVEQIPKNSLVKVLQADLEEYSTLDENVVDGKYDIFYHFAWEGTTGTSRNNMPLQIRNIQYTIDAVELAKRLGCHTFLGAGSQAEYGRVEGSLQAKTPAFPENGYGMAKLCAGQMSRQVCQSIGLKHIWTRILSVYGPYDGAGSMVSATIQKLLRGERAGFTPGEQKWDYLYSEDAAKAMLLLGQKGVSGKTYMIGSGKVRSLREYIQEIATAVEEVNQTTGELGFGDVPYADKQVMHLEANISTLTEDTGFVPQISFEEGIRRTVSYWKELQ